jgi:membrane-associated protease RseP (regulator of RpoE activity)
MKCREVLARYSDFIDGGLNEGKRKEIKDHLEFCEKCNDYQRILSDGLTSYRDLPKPKLSDDFYLRLQHRLFHLNERSRRKRKVNVLARGVIPTLSATIVFFISAFLFSSRLQFSGGPVETATVRNQLQEETVLTNVGGGTSNIGDSTVPTRQVPQGVKRDWDKKFVRNNMWRVLVEPPTPQFVGSGFSTVRGGALPVSVSTTSPERPRNLASLDNSRYVGLGVSVIPVEFQVDGEEDIEVKKGLRVLRVKQMTPAELAGILPGDTIVGLDNLPIEGPGELSQLIFSFAQQTKSIQIYRLGRLIELYVDL